MPLDGMERVPLWWGMETETDILDLIKREAAARGIAPSTLCLRALDDSQLPKRLARGGTMTVRSLSKLRAYLEAPPP